MVSYSHLLTFENNREIPENGPRFCFPLRVKKYKFFTLTVVSATGVG